MNSHLLPVAWFVVLLTLSVSCHVEVDKGPFTIHEDQAMISGKADFLDTISPGATGKRLPNILLILVDDLGKYDISTYNPGGVPTPALDRLASGGITFSSAYSSSSVCSPSRASLLTGRYQHRFGFERQPMNRYPRNRMEYWMVDRLIDTDPMQLVTPMSRPSEEDMEKQGIPAGEILLPELLSKMGYRTGIYGKWHLGHREEFIPTNRGFHQQYGFYEAFTYYSPPGTRGMIYHRHDYFASKHIWRQKRKGTCAIRENNREIEDKEYLTFSLARGAGEFMEENRESPFFLYVPFNAPHTPFQVPEEYFNRFEHETDHNKRVYYGMISALDDAVGMILDQLDSLGLSENTLVIFASDNGGATYTGATDNGILKGGKFTQFEGGVNIPMIFSWKGILQSGTEYKSPVSLMDIYVTCASLAGAGLPEDRAFDGINLMPYLTGRDSIGPDRPLFWRTDFNKAVRYGPWKMIWNDRDEQVFLYNLENDPGEHKNQASAFPEKVTTIKNLFREWESEMKDPMWPGVMEIGFDLDGEPTLWAI